MGASFCDMPARARHVRRVLCIPEVRNHAIVAPWSPFAVTAAVAVNFPSSWSVLTCLLVRSHSAQFTLVGACGTGDGFHTFLSFVLALLSLLGRLSSALAVNLFDSPRPRCQGSISSVAFRPRSRSICSVLLVPKRSSHSSAVRSHRPQSSPVLAPLFLLSDSSTIRCRLSRSGCYSIARQDASRNQSRQIPGFVVLSVCLSVCPSSLILLSSLSVCLLSPPSLLHLYTYIHVHTHIHIHTHTHTHLQALRFTHEMFTF